MDDNSRLQIIPNSWAAAFLAPITALLGMVLMRLALITIQKTGVRARHTMATITWTQLANA